MDDIAGSPYLTLVDVENSKQLLNYIEPYDVTAKHQEHIATLIKELINTSAREIRPLLTSFMKENVLYLQISIPYRPYDSPETQTEYKVKNIETIEFPIDRELLSDHSYCTSMSTVTGIAIINLSIAYGALTDMYLHTLVSPFHSTEKKKQTIAFEIGDGLVDFCSLSDKDLMSLREKLIEYESL